MNTAKLLDLRNLFTSQYGTRNSRWLWILKSSTVLSPWLTMPKLLNPVFMVQTYIFVAWTSVFLTQWHDRTVSSLPQVGKRTRFKHQKGMVNRTHTHTIPSWICNKYIHKYNMSIPSFAHAVTCKSVCVYVCLYACMHVFVCMCMRMHMCMPMCTYATYLWT